MKKHSSSDTGILRFITRTFSAAFAVMMVLPLLSFAFATDNGTKMAHPQYTTNDYGPYDDTTFLAGKFIGTSEEIRNPWQAKEKGKFIFSMYWASAKTLPDLTPVGTRSHSDFRVFVSKNSDADGWNAWFILKVKSLGKSSYSKADFAIWHSRGTDGRWHAMTETALDYEDTHEVPKDTVDFNDEDVNKILLDDTWMLNELDKGDLGRGALWDHMVKVVPLGEGCKQRIQAERHGLAAELHYEFDMPAYLAARHIDYPYALVYDKVYGSKGVMACIGNFYDPEHPRTIIYADTLAELYENLAA